jgi:putative endonuclease
VAVHRSPTQPFAKDWAIPTFGMYYIYILKSEQDDGYYIGSSGDLKRRKAEHDRGLVNATCYRRPLTLIYYEAYSTKDRAQERERKLKDFGSAYKGLLKRLGEC